MNRIELFKTETGWNAAYYGPHASHIFDLFGSNVLPTAFTADASRETVMAEISRLNPNVEVKHAN